MAIIGIFAFFDIHKIQKHVRHKKTKPDHLNFNLYADDNSVYIYSISYSLVSDGEIIMDLLEMQKHQTKMSTYKNQIKYFTDVARQTSLATLGNVQVKKTQHGSAFTEKMVLHFNLLFKE